jgi:hypothetical protein
MCNTLYETKEDVIWYTGRERKEIRKEKKKTEGSVG